MATGGNTGDNVGSLQDDAFQGHRMEPLSPQTTFYGTGPANTIGLTPGSGRLDVEQATTGDPVTDGTNGTPRTSSETRPKNFNINFIIKT
jgi:hypothetical protein